MRRRLLLSTLGITVATVALFGIPLAFVLVRVVHDDAQSQLTRDANRVAGELSNSGVLNDPPDALAAQLRRFTPEGDSTTIRFPDGRRFGDEPPGKAIVATVPGPSGTAITLATSRSDVNDRVRRALGLLLAVGVAAFGAALALALVQSRRLAAPLDRLSRSATRLGNGDFSIATPRSGISEVDQVAAALDTSAGRIDRLLNAERSFSTHASHQLRSALTGLELRLDELTQHDDPEVKSEANAALDQAHRLNDTVDELLALARTGRAGIVTEFDLAELARTHAYDASPALERGGRRLVVDAPVPARVVAAVGAIGQVLDILLSNATRHGRGTVTIRVYADERRASVEVADEGPGLDAGNVDAGFREAVSTDGHGIGLALARRLMTAEGGTIVLAHSAPPVFRIELPRA